MFGSTFIRFAAIVALTIPAASGFVVADNDPVGTTFTYQGRLTEAGAPAAGTVDLVFRLFDQADGGNALGELFADDLEIGEDGRFTIDLDFGGQFNGGPRWLETPPTITFNFSPPPPTSEAFCSATTRTSPRAGSSSMPSERRMECSSGPAGIPRA